MKYSTPKLTIPSFTFRLEVIVGIILLYLIISCLVFGSCLKVSFGSLVQEGAGFWETWKRYISERKNNSDVDERFYE